MKKLKLIISFLLLSLFVSTANSANINSIQAEDNATIKMTASPEVIFSDTKIYGEVKVLRDINVSYSYKDLDNSKKIVLNLTSDLLTNSTYSIISITWAEGNLDFEIWEKLNWEILNKNIIGLERTIEKVNILDSRTIELFFNYDIEEDIFDFKLLSELIVSSLSSQWNNILNIEMQDFLEKSTTYIVMITSLEDIDGNEILFDETLYDLNTSSNLIIKSEAGNKKPVRAEEEEKGNIEEVALNSAEIPETWAETWVLMLLTFIFSGIYFIKNKFSK